MTYTEKLTAELSSYLPPLTARPDLDEFWAESKAELAKYPMEPVLTPVEYPIPNVKVFDISFASYLGTRIHGIYILPDTGKTEKLPCIVNYHGYTDCCGVPSDFMHWIMLGAAVISVDCRDQSGKTGNAATEYGIVGNILSRGITDKYGYYFRGLYLDAIRALDFAESRSEIDSSRIIVHGASQGGALGMAVSALDSRPWIAMVDIPSNCDLVTRVEGPSGSYSAINEYLRKYPADTDKAFETLSYFDNMNLAHKIKARVFASVGAQDPVCPAKCYFAAYNRITAPKEITVYPFGIHEVTRTHTEAKIRFLADQLK